jgi:glycosyltransferase involved in cell wall biosynthesis
MKLAIIISTYYRKDGRSSSFLTRALNSIANQTYQDYKIFLTGDRYENNEEFETICKSFPYPEKLFYQNLEVAKERDIFDNKVDIWKFGGTNAINHAINTLSDEGFNYIVKLDHDDFL